MPIIANPLLRTEKWSKCDMEKSFSVICYERWREMFLEIKYQFNIINISWHTTHTLEIYGFFRCSHIYSFILFNCMAILCCQFLPETINIEALQLSETYLVLTSHMNAGQFTMNFKIQFETTTKKPHTCTKLISLPITLHSQIRYCIASSSFCCFPNEKNFSVVTTLNSEILKNEISNVVRK